MLKLKRVLLGIFAVAAVVLVANSNAIADSKSRMTYDDLLTTLKGAVWARTYVCPTPGISHYGPSPDDMRIESSVDERENVWMRMTIGKFFVFEDRWGRDYPKPGTVIYSETEGDLRRIVWIVHTLVGAVHPSLVSERFEILLDVSTNRVVVVSAANPSGIDGYPWLESLHCYAQ